MAWVLDLDGVVWLADEPVPGAAAAIARLRDAGEAIAFVTNNSYAPRRDVEDKLAAMGIDPADGVITSAMATAGLLEPGETALLVGGPGLRQALEQRGVTVVGSGPADAVVVGLNPAFDYAVMREASIAVRKGARLVASNDDATFPTPDGPVPGGGAILASIVTATGQAPLVAGKPYAPMAELVRARLGTTGVCVGDRADTDGRFARALGYRFALVLSGVTRPADLPVDPAPDVVAPDLAAAVDELLGRT